MVLGIGACSSIGVLAAGIVILVIGLRHAGAGALTLRIQEYVQAAGVRPNGHMESQRARRAELSGSFHTRVLLPAFRRVTRLLGRLTPRGMFAELKHQLAIAGNPLGLGPREFYGLRLAFTLLGFWLAFSFLRSGLARPQPTAWAPASARSGLSAASTGYQPIISPTTLMGSALALIVCNYLPKTWLRRRVRRRHDSIRRGLPDALDMLSVCAEAGLGFDQALQRVSEYWKTPLGAELGRVVVEMGMGLPRREALRNLADRVDLLELSSFIAVILQSDQLGMSINKTLHAQAEQMRIERRFRAQELARKMPLKMLFPLLLLIFPAMFAVILGPIIPILGDFFSNLVGSVG